MITNPSFTLKELAILSDMVNYLEEHSLEGQGANAPGATVETCNLCDTFCTGACRLDMDQHHDHDHVDGHDHHHHDHDHAHPVGEPHEH